jgi:GT2 family glycosyltransferase
MYLEQDTYCRRSSFGGPGAAKLLSANCHLLRVEHFDKGVPFDESLWKKPREVPAITGALMAFKKREFEKLGGFSAQYIYGHYEDADLSLRWAANGGQVAIHPFLRMVHLEGQGSNSRGDVFRGASTVNRYLFTATHRDQLNGARETLAQPLRRAS